MSLTENQNAAMFLPFLCSPEVSRRSWCVRDAILKNWRQRWKQNPRVGLRATTEIYTWNEFLEVVNFPARVATMALGVLGLMGAILSITGIFGMAAYSVSKRLKELGIRVALGAQRREVLGPALGRAVKLLAAGSAAGLVLGVLASRVLASIVYQATPRDPLVLAGVVAAMLLLGLLATWIPAQRALTVNPLAVESGERCARSP
jgi:ABC-type antimicrobial peptide transport system permease subunit